MKIIQGISRNCQSITLLYFLFIATIIHLGYFVLNAETQSLVFFSLSFIFIYLIDKNMIVVLGLSLLFVDILYMLQKIPEGFDTSNPKDSDTDSSDTTAQSDSSSVKSKNITEEIMMDIPSQQFKAVDPYLGTDMKLSSEKEFDLSGNMIKETMTNSKHKPVKKVKEPFEDTNPVNPLVKMSETIGKEKMEGKPLNEVQEESKQMKSMLDKLKDTPEVSESLKSLNGVDIHELNKLINNLNSVVNSFSS